MDRRARVLIVASAADWLGVARLPGGLHAAGAGCALLAPPETLTARSRHVERHFLWTGADAAALERACAEFSPDWLIAADERALLWLDDVRAAAPSAPVRALLDRLPPLWQMNKWEMARRAHALGLPVPVAAQLRVPQGLDRFARTVPPPLVIKPVLGHGGHSVRICDDLPSARAAMVGGQVPWLAQRYQPGRTWICAFHAWRGELRTVLCAAKVHQHPAGIGPGSLIEIREQPDLRALTAKLVRGLEYSGLGGIDFIVGEDGRAWFIELNPRPVPILHLGRRAGPDPCAALAADLAGRTFVETPLRKPVWRVALFPQELQRDPAGAGLNDGELDLPRDDPALLAALAARLSPEGRATLESRV